MTWCDLHYSLDDCLGVGTQPAHPSLPSTVWVAVAVHTKSVVVQNGAQAATKPISGRMSIFEKRSVTTTEVFRAEVICVSDRRQDCEAAVQANRAEGVEYSITEHAVGLTRQAEHAPASTGAVPCIDCGTPVVGGPVKCQKCIEKQWAEQRAAFAASGGVLE